MPGRKPTCSCGACLKCKNREACRRHAAAHPNYQRDYARERYGHAPRAPAWEPTEEDVALLGTMPDKLAAPLLGVSYDTVGARRRRLGIPPYRRPSAPKPDPNRPRVKINWTPEDDALLGTMSDAEVGERLGRSEKAAFARRNRLGIHAVRRESFGRDTTERGYIELQLRSDDPLVGMTKGNSRRVMEHRYVVAQSLGRPLTRDEFVHHRNGIRHDNRPENLELWTRAHPDGQRVADVYAWAREFVERYEREVEAEALQLPEALRVAA